MAPKPCTAPPSLAQGWATQSKGQVPQLRKLLIGSRRFPVLNGAATQATGPYSQKETTH